MLATKRGDSSEAMEMVNLFNEAIQADPNSMVVYLNKAMFVLQVGSVCTWLGSLEFGGRLVLYYSITAASPATPQEPRGVHHPFRLVGKSSAGLAFYLGGFPTIT